jgi:hypothetical protein
MRRGLGLERGDRAARIAAGVWILTLLAAAGCGWFEPRNPIKGETAAPVPWVSPIEPELVLANMDTAMTYLSRGIDNYAKCYADTFHFYPYPDDANTLAQQGRDHVYDDWTLTVERDVTDLILGLAKTVDLRFEGHDVVADDSQYKIWEERYTLVIDYLSGQEETYEGVARLELRVDPSQANQWYITRWQDFLKAGQPDSVHTWGRLRGERRPI